ncbi:GntR family transcriptional regulator [Micromonospora sp. C81]|uniref:GntR family transcriptional regulator n=1 Tax=Micromonospora sp. C81 TaxID=2824881 RepID=UPI001B38498D|nr:GntR family transcriptional regulator [Micromonospora sp. C81]MBQ1035365.1 GntR family transcriptional regulator [Micromonospora sp. C81]
MPTPHYGQPRYRAIAQELSERIESGVIPPGALLPTESALTAEFQASRGTIRQALSALRENGLTTTEHGRGTYANPHPYEPAPTENLIREVRQREVVADIELATLFSIEVGSTLVLHESVTRSQSGVEAVSRTYRLAEGDQ